MAGPACRELPVKLNGEPLSCKQVEVGSIPIAGPNCSRRTVEVLRLGKAEATVRSRARAPMRT